MAFDRIHIYNNTSIIQVSGRFMFIVINLQLKISKCN